MAMIRRLFAVGLGSSGSTGGLLKIGFEVCEKCIVLGLGFDDVIVLGGTSRYLVADFYATSLFESMGQSRW